MTQTGTTYVYYVAQYNSNTGWSDIGGGLASFAVNVVALDLSNTFYVGGNFSASKLGTALTRVGRFVNGIWNNPATNANNIVNSIAFDPSNNDVYMGSESVTLLGGIVKLVNGSWATVAGGLSGGGVLAISFDLSNNLYVGGKFTAAKTGGVLMPRISKLVSGTWTSIGGGLNNNVNTIVFDSSNNLYAGGDFTATYAGDVSLINYVAKLPYGSSVWETVGQGTGGGFNAYVKSLKVDMSNNLYAGGNFTIANGSPVKYISSLVSNVWSPIGVGFNGLVNSIVFDLSNNLYAGGNFTKTSDNNVTLNYIAKYSIPPPI